MTKTLTLHDWLTSAKPVPQTMCLFTDEPLFQTQVADTYRKRLRQSINYQRHVLEQNKDFNHAFFLSLLAENSLFGDVSLIELRLTQNKLNAEFVQTLEQTCNWLAEGKIHHYVVIIGPTLSKTHMASAGFKNLWAHFTHIVCPTLTLETLPNWLIQSAQHQGFKLNFETAKWLAEQTEGNLLAAQQCLDKLAIHHANSIDNDTSHSTPKAIELSTVQHIATAACRFNVFDLGQNLLAGNPNRVLKVLHGLQAEGEAGTLVLWVLTEEIKTILNIKHALQQGQSLKQSCQTYRVWGERQKYISTACTRHTTKSLNKLLTLCYKAEKTLKGLAHGNSWHLFEMIALGITGHSTHLSVV